MKLTISAAAVRFLKRKEKYYLPRNRHAKLIEVARTCHGAEFRLVFEAPLAEDIVVKTDGCEILLAPRLAEEYGGFALDVHSFFFAPKLMITPFVQSYNCDCKTKCNNQPATQYTAGNL